MHLGAVDAVVGKLDAVVIILRAAVIADADQFAILRPVQIGSIGDISDSGGGQQQRTAVERAGGSPLQDPWIVVLQHHAAAEGKQTAADGVTADLTNKLGGLVEGAASGGHTDQFIVDRFPAVVGRAGGVHGRFIDIAGKVAAGVMVTVGAGFAPVGAEIQPSGQSTDGHILNLKQIRIDAAGDPEGQGRIGI